MRVNDKYSQCEFCKRRFNQCTHCNPGYKAYDNFELDEKAYYDERRIRQDERNRIIRLLKSDLENLDLSVYDNFNMSENYAIKDYIESTIKLLEKEQ